MANVPATIDPTRPAWMAKYVPDASVANAEYLIPTGVPFGVVTIENKIWAGKIGKEPSVKLKDEQGFPVPYFDAVIVAANPATTKTFYLTGYPGKDASTSNAPPDCASDDGIEPLPNVPHKQNPTCSGCQHNVFRPNNPPGQRGKRCQDNKRLAVLPDADDWQNEMFNGPMLLRLAPSSRTTFGEYAAEQSALGRALHGIVTRMSFDSDQSGIVINFQFLRYLEETDMPDIMQWRNTDYIARVLGTEHAPEWKPPVVQEGEAGEATAAQTAPKPKLNGGGNGLAAAVDVAEKAIIKPTVAAKPIEPVKEAAPPKLTAEEKKAARIAAVKAEMEAELAAKMKAMETDEAEVVEGEPIDDTEEVMAMLDKIAQE